MVYGTVNHFFHHSTPLIKQNPTLLPETSFGGRQRVFHLLHDGPTSCHPEHSAKQIMILAGFAKLIRRALRE